MFKANVVEVVDQKQTYKTNDFEVNEVSDGYGAPLAPPISRTPIRPIWVSATQSFQTS